MDLLAWILSGIQAVIALIVFVTPTYRHDEVALFVVIGVNEIGVVPIDAPGACWRFCLFISRLAGRVECIVCHLLIPEKTDGSMVRCR